MEWNGGVDYGMDYMEASCAADITISHCTSASSAKPRVKVLTPTASRLREEGEYLLALTLLDFCLWHG